MCRRNYCNRMPSPCVSSKLPRCRTRWKSSTKSTARGLLYVGTSMNNAPLDILDKSVPIEAHYQVLPLLREVKRERLLRERVRERENGREAEEERGGLHGLDIVRWEEEMLHEERVTYERYSLDETPSNFWHAVSNAKSNVPRFVVLGPPGSEGRPARLWMATHSGPCAPAGVGGVGAKASRFGNKPA